MNRPQKRIGPPQWPLAAVLALVFAGVSPRAQDTNPPTETNDVVQAERVIAEDAAELLAETTNEVAAVTNHATEAVAAPTPDARTRRREREKQNRAHNASLPPLPAPSVATNAPAALDFSAFRLITERNIFDPNRSPRAVVSARPKTVDAFSLVGTMSYAKGDFAFFDGTSSDYRKVLKVAGTIAGYTVQAISPDSVKLVRENQQLDLAVGTQLRRQDDGTWVKAAAAGAYAASSSSANPSSSDSSGSGGESDIIKRLMMRRQQE